MLGAIKDGAPFCPLAIHVDALCCAMAPTAMYSGKALVVGGERAGGRVGWMVAGVCSERSWQQGLRLGDGKMLKISRARDGAGLDDDCGGSGSGSGGWQWCLCWWRRSSGGIKRQS